MLGGAIRRGVETDTRAAAWLTMANTTGAFCGRRLRDSCSFRSPAWSGHFSAGRSYASSVSLIVGSLGLTSKPSSVARRDWHRSRCARADPFSVRAMKDRYFPRAAAAYADDGSQIVATREGRSETIFLMQQKWMGQPVYNRLVTNGFSMTGTAVPGMRYMRYFAYWPMLLHNGPIRHALLVCYGVGVTAGAVLDIPSLESLDIAEISRDIVAMSDVIYAGERHPLHDPRVRLHLEDGRFVLATSDQKFDLITGEPPPPRTPGAVNIYTREYFQLVYDRLAEGGIDDVLVAGRAPGARHRCRYDSAGFCDVFADCSLWNATPFDLMMVGPKHATGPVRDEQMRAPWQTPCAAGAI